MPQQWLEQTPYLQGVEVQVHLEKHRYQLHT